MHNSSLISDKNHKNKFLPKCSQGSSTLNCGDFTRSRKRTTDVEFERNLDHFLHLLGTWSKSTINVVTRALITRCPLQQLEFLWMSMESANHRDVHYSILPPSCSEGVVLRPLSTSLSRAVREHFEKSRNKAKKRLHRMESVVMHSEEDVLDRIKSTYPISSISQQDGTGNERWATPPTRSYSSKSETFLDKRLHKRSGTAPVSLRTGRMARSTRQNSASRPVSSLGRIGPPSPAPSLPSRPLSTSSAISRRHTSASLSLATSQHLTLKQSHFQLKKGIKLAPHPKQSVHNDDFVISVFKLPFDVRLFISWFSELEFDWQQQEVLQGLLWHLDDTEVFVCAAFLIVRRYRDFLSQLSCDLSERILLLLQPKDLLLASHVCRAWRSTCHRETLWRAKCTWEQLALPTDPAPLSWRKLYLKELRLRGNWRKARCSRQSFQHHSRSVVCVKIRGTRLVASSSLDKTVKLWDLKTGRLLKTLTGHRRGVWALCFYGKNLLISGSHDQTIKIWNIEMGTCERTLVGHQGPIWCVQQQKDYLISASDDYSAILWNVRHCRFHCQLLGHKGAVFAADLNQEATVALTASGDKSISLWSVSSGQRLKSIRASKSHPIMNIRWRGDSILCCHGNMVSLISNQKGEPIKLLDLKGHEDKVKDVSLLVGDGKDSVGMGVSCSVDGSIRTWTLSRGRCVRCFDEVTSQMNSIDSNGIVIVGGSSDGVVHLWDFM